MLAISQKRTITEVTQAVATLSRAQVSILPWKKSPQGTISPSQHFLIFAFRNKRRDDDLSSHSDASLRKSDKLFSRFLSAKKDLSKRNPDESSSSMESDGR